jgi:hypothetical protein
MAASQFTNEAVMNPLTVTQVTLFDAASGCIAQRDGQPCLLSALALHGLLHDLVSGASR